jgi:hypothetical protein
MDFSWLIASMYSLKFLSDRMFSYLILVCNCEINYWRLVHLVRVDVLEETGKFGSEFEGGGVLFGG